jgi:hypothetical protein
MSSFAKKFDSFSTRRFSSEEELLADKTWVAELRGGYKQLQPQQADGQRSGGQLEIPIP